MQSFITITRKCTFYRANGTLGLVFDLKQPRSDRVFTEFFCVTESPFVIWNQVRSWGIQTCVRDKECYCDSLSEPHGCGLLHGQGRSFALWNKNGFSTVWRTIVDYPWTDLNRSVQESVRQGRVWLARKIVLRKRELDHLFMIRGAREQESNQ